MKKCPKCGQVYVDDGLNFCGEINVCVWLLAGADAVEPVSVMCADVFGGGEAGEFLDLHLLAERRLRHHADAFACVADFETDASFDGADLACNDPKFVNPVNWKT